MGGAKNEKLSPLLPVRINQDMVCREASDMWQGHCRKSIHAHGGFSRTVIGIASFDRYRSVAAELTITRKTADVPKIAPQPQSTAVLQVLHQTIRFGVQRGPTVVVGKRKLKSRERARYVEENCLCGAASHNESRMLCSLRPSLKSMS